MGNWINDVYGVMQPRLWSDGNCSKCGFTYDDSYGIPGNFCPKCGERMDNGQDDITDICVRHHYDVEKCKNCKLYDNDQERCSQLKITKYKDGGCYRYFPKEGFNICESCSVLATCPYSKDI